jgi:hypothetical protein
MPEDKVASLQDLSTTYAVDEKTGQLKPIKLGTDARDDVLRISAQAVKDLGKANVNGREVRALQSADGVEPVKTVYVNPADGKPVEVELAWPSTGESFVYTDIQIDTDLDEKLFSLQPPDGYEMAGGHAEPRKPVDDINGQLMAKMKHLMMECAIYANEHGGKWPTRLDDLRAAGMDATKLQTLITATDSKDGKPVIEYRQPKAGQVEGVVAYEIPEIRRGGKVVAGFMDGHVELMSKEDFDAQVK